MEQLKTALFLDDKRTPLRAITGFKPWVIVRTAQGFYDYIRANGVPDFISFTHDLHPEHYQDFATYQAQGIAAIQYGEFEHPTGFDVAQWLCQYVHNSYASATPLTLGLCGVHAENPLGAHNIRHLLNNFKREMGWPQDVFVASIPCVEL